MRRYEIPAHNAYHDGTRYHCVKIECFADGANLKEIDRIPAGKPLTYTPILRCSECGATYFGLLTRDHEAKQEITKHAEKQKRAEEERTRLATQDNTEATKEIRRKEAKEERIIQEEIERHEAQNNGDIILPNILTV